MTDSIFADIFFTVTSVGVVIVTILAVTILYYLLILVKNAKDISERIREGSEMIKDDLLLLREEMKEEKSKAKSIARTVLGVLSLGAKTLGKGKGRKK